MDKKKSIIVEADEATQGIMNEIGNQFSDSLDKGFSSMRDDLTDDIVMRLQSIDVFKMTPEQLKKLKEDTQKLISQVSPIESGIKAQQSAIASTQSAISKIESKIDDALKLTTDSQNEKLTALATEIEKIQETLGIIVNLVTPFWKRWRKSDKNDD